MSAKAPILVLIVAALLSAGPDREPLSRFRSCNGSEGFAAGHAWVRSCSEGGRGLDGATLATPTARLGMWMLVTSPLLFPCGYLPLGPAARRHTPGDHRGCGESTMSQGSWARE
jgi:hypothetical protein